MSDDNRLTRWRHMLGEPATDALGVTLTGAGLTMDRALQALYDGERHGGLGPSAPNVNRWLGDIRQYFPAGVVRVMQKDAIERLGLTKLLMEPETLSAVEADVHLVATLVSLKGSIPERTKSTARAVVRKVVDDVMKKLNQPMKQAVKGALSRATRTSRPKASEIDWDRTIRRNLKNNLPKRKTIIAETLTGFGRKRSSLRDVILCVDQSGSMAASVVYSSIFGAVLASMPTVKTRMVVFDTAFVDLTPELKDPVDLLFGTQLGGGTDIERALAYCQSQVTEPGKTILVLISDLIEGGTSERLLKRVAAIVGSAVNMVTLLALSDDGAPAFDANHAAAFAALGSPAFACTPDQFPGLMAAAIQRQDIARWAASAGIVTSRAAGA